MIDAMIPNEAKAKGNNAPALSTMLISITALEETPRVMAAIIDPTYDSKRSAPIPATSPTLSPTLSAITAGFLGSSSGIPASTFPTRSAPTSAAFVKIPPPTLAKRATELAPREYPEIVSRGEIGRTSVLKSPTCSAEAGGAFEYAGPSDDLGILSRGEFGRTS